MNAKFPDVLRVLHAQSGLSHRKFAKKCGISPSSLTRYKNDETDPGLPVIKRIAANLGQRVAVLTGDEPLPALKKTQPR